MKKRIRHGESKTHLFKKWASMIARVSPKWKHREFYFDKGITVCDQWQTFLPFKEWALKNGYAQDLELDRINNDLGYSPENCRFVPKIINTSNRSNTVMVDYKGEHISLTILCARLNISEKDNRTIRRRISNGWPVAEAIETPVMGGNFGHSGPRAVIDISTNQRFESLKEASLFSGIASNKLSEKLNGKRKNNTSFRWAEDFEFAK